MKEIEIAWLFFLNKGKNILSQKKELKHWRQQQSITECVLIMKLESQDFNRDGAQLTRAMTEACI